MKNDNSLFKFESMINSILEQSVAFQRSRVLLTAYELDIFTMLGENSKSAQEIAQELNADNPALERLMNALVSLDLLEKIGRKYRNTKASYTLLVRGNPNYMSNLNHMNFMWDRWTTLTETIMKGTATNPKKICEWTEKQINDFLAAMHWRANLYSPEIVRMINLSNTESILDLGCGTGVIGMEILKSNPSIQITFFDFPCVIDKTLQYVERKGLQEHINVIKGDFTKDDFGKGYDMIILSQVLHGYSIWENLETMRKVFDALNPGGNVIIHEYLLNESRDRPLFSALFSLDMLVTTKSGEVLTETDAWLLLKESMFSDIKREETSFGTYVIMGKK